MGLGKGLRGMMRGVLGLLAGVVMVGGMGETAGGQVLPELSFTGAFPVSGDPGTNECPRGEELESSTDKVWEGGWLALRVERAATRREAARIEVDFEIVGGSQAGRADLGTGGNLRNVGILFYESVITAPTRHCHYVQILKDKKLEGNERLTLRLRPKGSVYTVKAGKDRRDIEIGEAGAGIRLRYQDLGVLGGGTTGRRFVLRLEAGVASGAGNACTFERDRSFSRTVKVGWRVWDGGRGDLRGANLGDFNLPTRVTFRSGVAVVEGSARADGDRESEDFWMELDYKYRDRVNHPYPVVHCESAADARRWGLTRSFFGPVGVIAPVPGAPAKPLGLTAGAVEDRVNLSWRAATDGTIKGWRYRLRAKGLRSWGSGVEMRGSVAGTRAHAVDGSSWWDGIATEFQVQSYNDGGSSPWSDTAVAVAVNRDRPALVISKGRVSVEEGETASWTVALNGGVGGSVTLASSASGTARVSPAVLTFTSENARVPQTVRVTGVTAGEAEVRHAFTLPGATAAAVTDAGRVAVTVTAAAVPLRAPAKPTDLSAKAVEDEVGLSWKAATDATIQGWRYRYRMFDYWYSATDFPGKTTASTRSGSVSFAAFLEGITLEFQVQSYNEAGSSPWSNTAKTAVVNSDRPALLISERRVSVEEGETASWTVAVNGTFDGSVTLVSSDSGKARVSPSVLYFAHATAQTPQTVTVTGVTAGEAEVSHAFRVDGASVPVASGAKDRVAVTVTAAAVPLRAPAKPTDLSAKAVEDEVGLSWKAATDATIQGWRYRYRMFDYWYSATDFPGKTTASTRSGSVSFAAFLEGITLEFQVQSYNEAGSSPWSNTAKTAVVNSDRPALLISERRVSVEEGETASWTVAVNGTFDGSVTLVSSDSGKARVSPSVLYFAHATAQTPQTVTVTGVTAGEAEVSHAFRVDGASVPVASGAKDRVAVTVTAAPVPETPSAPKGFRARPGDEAVTLSWAASGDGSIRKYEVKWRLAGPGQGWGSWAAIAGSGANTTSHTVTGLTNGQKYIFRVRAVNAGGEGKSSRARGATPMGGVTVAVEDAIVVEGDAGRRVMEFDVTLSGEPVAEVKVRVAAVAGAGSTAGAGRDFVPLSKTLFFDAYGRGSALMQTVRVEVMGDEVAEGEETFLLRLDNLVTGDSRVELAGGGEKVTATGTITDDDAAPVLAALADVTAKVGQEVSVTATATDADGDTLRYVWSRKTGETTPALPEGTDLNAARLVFTPTRAGTMTMTVTADDGHGNTDTEEVVVTVAASTPPPAKPTGLVARPGNGAVSLSWDDPDDASITGYELRWKVRGGDGWSAWSSIAGSGAATVSHEVSGLTNGRKYTYRLRALNGAGAGEKSESASATPTGALTVTVSDARVAEGDEGQTMLEFPITLSGSPADDVKVRVTALAGPESSAAEAGDGRDFVPFSKTIVFAANARGDALVNRVRVRVLGDHVAEEDETFLLRLGGLETEAPRVALAGGGENLVVTGTIANDDAAPVLADVQNTSVVGPDLNVDVTVSATDADGDAINYTWVRKKGETTPALPEGTDVNSNRLFFKPPGVGTYSMRVTADDGHGNSDYKDMVITIHRVPTVSVPAVLKVTEGTDTKAVVTVTASKALGRSVTFDVTYGGTATGAADPANGDYDNDAVTSVTLGASDTTKTITIPLGDDRRDEADETITVTLALAQGSMLPAGFVLGNAATTVVIKDNDASPVLAPFEDRSVIGRVVDITVSATDADGDTINYTWRRKEGETTPALPEGTDLNSARLFFTVPDYGVYTMRVTANDGHGNSDSFTLKITVITVSPLDDTGVPIDLTVNRRGDKLHLSWTAPDHPGRTGWQARYRTFNGSMARYERWHDWVTIPDASATSYVLTSDECLPSQEVELRATTATWATRAAKAHVPSKWDTTTWGVYWSYMGWTVEWPSRKSKGFPSPTPPAEGDAVEYWIHPRKAPTAPLELVPMPFVVKNGEWTYTDKATIYSGGPNYLTFTPSNWNKPQVIWVKLNADEDTSDHGITVLVRAKGGGHCYPKDGMFTRSLWVRDTTPTLTLGANPARVSEGTPITLAVRSDKPVPGVLSVSLTLSDRDSSGFTADDIQGALTRTFNVNFGGRRTGTIAIRTSVDADASEGVEKYTVTLNDATGYAIGEEVTVQGKLLDGPPGTGYQGFTGDTGTTVGLTVTPTALTISEGGSGTYTVVLDEAPADTVMVTPASDNTAIATVSGPLTFTTANWNTPQPVTVTGVPDDDTDDDTVTLRHTAMMGNMEVAVTGGSVTVTVEDTMAAHANKVHRAVLPQVAAAMASQSLDAVAGRIQAVASGKAGRSLHFGVAQAAPGAREGADGVWLEEQRRAWPRGMLEDEWGSGRGSGLRGMLEKEAENPDLRDMLDGAAFALPMGASGMSGGSVPRVAVWGRGDLDSLSGSEEDVSWDGEVWSAHLGTDVRLRADVLAGVALSHSRGELDTEVDDAGGNRVKGVYKTELTAVHPYAAWLSGDGSNLWASAGYGEGEVGVEEAERADREVEMKLTSAAAGGRGVLSEDGEWIAGGVTRVAVRGEGSMVRVKTEAGSGLEALSVDARRLRLALEGSYERALEGGGTVTPALEVGMRHDSGDVEKGVGAEVGASVSWREPGMGLTVELRTRALVAHERDREEWGVGGMVQLDPGADGSGLFLTLTPAYGVTATDLDGLFDRTPGTSFLTGSGAEAESQLDAEVGYGFGVLGSGPMALLSPYVGFTLAERGEGSVRVGTRYTIAPAFELSFEGERSQDRDSADHSLEVRVSLRW